MASVTEFDELIPVGRVHEERSTGVYSWFGSRELFSYNMASFVSRVSATGSLEVVKGVKGSFNSCSERYTVRWCSFFQKLRAPGKWKFRAGFLMGGEILTRKKIYQSRLHKMRSRIRIPEVGKLQSI